MTIKIEMDLTKEMANKITISTQATDMHGNYTMQVPRFVATYFQYQLRDRLLLKKEEPCNCITCHRFPQWVQNEIGKNIQSYLDNQIHEKQLRDAGLLSHTDEQQELAQWKGLALAMSKLILENVK